ncbi:MAG TPA: amino acid adenylation domain-containing protein, partial [Longimicrobiaceae bacterium]|nr:amino acid adenylation domain-containing protein [Longimicrobiaceae bacterium]
ATLFMTVLAGWQALLGRYAGQEDVVVGSPVAGRTRVEVEGLIGFFVNLLALRGELGGDPSFGELVGRVREGALGAYAHQELPFERLVEELVTERSLTHAPLFQVTFALDRDDARDRLTLGEVRLEPFGAGEGTTRFDLALSMLYLPEGLAGALTYRKSLFEAETIERMGGHLEAVLETMAADPHRRLSQLSLLRPAERLHLLRAGHGPHAPLSGDLTLHARVLAQTRRTPHAPALLFDDQVLSYADLLRRASALAAALRRRGVRPELRVAVCMEPAPEMILSVLAVLLAGGAYLPLDPELPPQRRDFLLRDASVPLVLTQHALAARLAGCGCELLCVDPGEEQLLPREEPVAAAPVDPQNLAYVIYTSGSTGTPKGVLVPHQGVCNAVEAFRAAYRIGAGARVLLFAPLHFDASVLDIFTALCSGAALVVARREALMPGEELLELLRRQRVTHAKFTPSALAATPWAELPELEAIMSGGEACPAEVVRRWAPGRRFYNGYGPTETSVRVTVVETAEGRRPPPIGRAVANVRLYVLDGAGEPVPVGVPGELCVGGVQVTRGYLGRAEQTAAAYVPDALSGEAGAR